MVLTKTILFAALLAVVNSRSFKVNTPYIYIEDGSNIIKDDIEGVLSKQQFESIYPTYNAREKRDVQGTINSNPDGSVNLFGKIPLAGDSHNILSATGSVTNLHPEGSYGSAGAGLSLDNVNGHGLSLSAKHIPSFGDQLTAAGKVNLLDTHWHNLNANAFATRNLPSDSLLPNFGTYGGGLDYTYNDKVGASLGVAHTPYFHKTDVSAMGNLNLFKDSASSLDFSAGATKSFSPFTPKSSWEPSVGLSYTKYF